MEESLYKNNTSTSASKNTDSFQQVDDYVRGSTWHLKKVKTIFTELIEETEAALKIMSEVALDNYHRGYSSHEYFNGVTQDHGLWQQISVRYCKREIQSYAYLCWVLQGEIMQDDEWMCGDCFKSGFKSVLFSNSYVFVKIYPSSIYMSFNFGG